MPIVQWYATLGLIGVRKMIHNAVYPQKRHALFCLEWRHQRREVQLKGSRQEIYTCKFHACKKGAFDVPIAESSIAEFLFLGCT